MYVPFQLYIQTTYINFFLNYNKVIAAKTMECDYRPINKRVSSAINDFNQQLQNQMAGKPSM